MEFTVDAAGYSLICTVRRMGDDCLVSLRGGDKAHIGSVAMAVPRPSLTGVGRSATVSTLNRTGHKDDFLANPIAHEVAARMDCVVVCSAGAVVHPLSTISIASNNATNRIVCFFIDAVLLLLLFWLTLKQMPLQIFNEVCGDFFKILHSRVFRPLFFGCIRPPSRSPIL